MRTPDGRHHPASGLSAPAPGSRVLAVTGLAVLGLTLAACGTDNGAGGTNGNGNGAQETPGAGQAQVAECVTGEWSATGLEGQIGGAAGEGTLSGGAGVLVTVDPDGATTVDFSQMEPVTFSGAIAEVEIGGEFTYAGQATGTVRTDVDTTSGQWEPVDAVDWSDVRVTLDTTEPVEGRPLDDVPVGDVIEQAEDVGDDVVEVEPILDRATFECQDDTLVLRAETDTAVTWTFSRA